ncbi:hypothetical protein [Methanoculleus bourgensis]|uniref:hypothetical protein n=1 Tax=Methanoculleus bourgensis TaxID=83986 RepID=UPI0015D272E9|nr:hypothetical protein [Methanoculleus bourgensis]
MRRRLREVLLFGSDLARGPADTTERRQCYYILAHQYIAAKLNVCNGCWAPCGICTAEELFNKYTPADIGTLKGNDPLRQQFLELAAYLDDYNNRNLNT